MKQFVDSWSSRLATSLDGRTLQARGRIPIWIWELFELARPRKQFVSVNVRARRRLK